MVKNKTSRSGLHKKVVGQLEQIRRLCEENRASNDVLQEIDALRQMLKEESKEENLALSAQLSIYPLRQPSLSPPIQQALDVLKEHHLKVIPGSMSTLILGSEENLWKGIKEAFSTAAGHGEVVMIVSLSNACPKPSE